MHEPQEITLKSLLPALLIWGGTVYGVLQLQYWDFGFSKHSICGLWGCGPPLQALVAYHGFWCALLIPPAVWGGRRIPAQLEGRIGAVLGVGLLVAIIGFLCWNTGRWIAKTGHDEVAVQHALFTVAVLVDVPMIPVLICCLWFWIDALNRKRAELFDSFSVQSHSDLTATPPTQ